VPLAPPPPPPADATCAALPVPAGPRIREMSVAAKSDRFMGMKPSGQTTLLSVGTTTRGGIVAAGGAAAARVAFCSAFCGRGVGLSLLSPAAAERLTAVSVPPSCRTGGS